MTQTLLSVKDLWRIRSCNGSPTHSVWLNEFSGTIQYTRNLLFNTIFHWRKQKVCISSLICIELLRRKVVGSNSHSCQYSMAGHSQYQGHPGLILWNYVIDWTCSAYGLILKLTNITINAESHLQENFVWVVIGINGPSFSVYYVSTLIMGSSCVPKRKKCQQALKHHPSAPKGLRSQGPMIIFPKVHVCLFQFCIYTDLDLKKKNSITILV